MSINKEHKGLSIRLLGKDLPAEKRAIIALQYIRGIGLHLAREICEYIKVNESMRFNQLTQEQLRLIEKYIESNNILVENDLERLISTNVNRKISNGSREGRRRLNGLPMSGRSRSNGKTAKKMKAKTGKESEAK